MFILSLHVLDNWRHSLKYVCLSIRTLILTPNTTCVNITWIRRGSGQYQFFRFLLDLIITNKLTTTSNYSIWMLVLNPKPCFFSWLKRKKPVPIFHRVLNVGYSQGDLIIASMLDNTSYYSIGELNLTSNLFCSCSFSLIILC